MNTPPTLVLRDDGERTIVDRTPPPPKPFPAADTSCTSRQSGSGPMLGRWRSALVVAFGAAVSLSLLVAADQQRRVSVRLERTVTALQHARQRPPGEGASRLAPPDNESLKRADASPRVADGPVVDREQLELEAASLLIANDYEEALARYRRLAKRFPEDRVFSDLVAILGAKVLCRANGGSARARCD